MKNNEIKKRKYTKRKNKEEIKNYQMPQLK